MFNRNWIAILAFGGCLGLASAGLAIPPDASRNTDNRQHHEAKPGGIETAVPKPVNCFGASEQEKDTAYYQECDLQAQWSMATTTERILWLAYIQFALTIVATYLLWRTFGETRKSSEAATKAVGITEKSEMAYILVTEVHIANDLAKAKTATSFQPKFIVQIGNYGKTPGFVRGMTLHYEPGVKGQELRTMQFQRGGDVALGFFISAGQVRPATVAFGKAAITGPEFFALRNGTTRLFVHGKIDFDGIFGESWSSNFAYRLSLYPSAKPVQKNIHVGGAAYWKISKQEG